MCFYIAASSTSSDSTKRSEHRPETKWMTSTLPFLALIVIANMILLTINACSRKYKLLTLWGNLWTFDLISPSIPFYQHWPGKWWLKQFSLLWDFHSRLAKGLTKRKVQIFLNFCFLSTFFSAHTQNATRASQTKGYWPDTWEFTQAKSLSRVKFVGNNLVNEEIFRSISFRTKMLTCAGTAKRTSNPSSVHILDVVRVLQQS